MSTPLTTAIRPLILFQGITGLTGGGAGNLDGILTALIPVPLTGFFSVGGSIVFYQLRAGTDVESAPDIVRPDDYAGGTNEKVWELVPVTAATAGALLAANNLSDLGDLATALANLGAGDPDGLATLDATGKVPASQLPAAVVGAVAYQGTWNASTNTPTLADGTGTQGFYYKVSVAGTTSIDGIAEWNVGDWAVFNGTTWDKIDNTEEDATASLKGRVQLAGDLAGTAASPTLKASASAISPAFATLSDAATVAWDLASARNSNAVVTLGGNRALSISNMASGCTGTLIVKQDATGSRTLSLPAGSKVPDGGSGAVTLSTGANAIDVLAFVYDGSNFFWTLGKNFS